MKVLNARERTLKNRYDGKLYVMYFTTIIIKKDFLRVQVELR